MLNTNVDTNVVMDIDMDMVMVMDIDMDIDMDMDMENPFAIRKADAEDAYPIKEIMEDAFLKYKNNSGITGPIDALEETVDDIKKDIDTIYVFVAAINDYIVGTIRVNINPKKNTAYISRFGVRCGFSNRGIGNSLMKYVNKLLNEKGIILVYLHVALSNTDLVRFYCNRGFNVDSVSAERGYKRALMVKNYYAG